MGTLCGDLTNGNTSYTILTSKPKTIDSGIIKLVSIK